MMGVSLFGTCTMKYNPRLATRARRPPRDRRAAPDQDEETLQGVLAHRPRPRPRSCAAVSGMDAFVFQAGGGAARRLHPRLCHARLPRRARRARAARRDHHDDPGAPVQRRDGGRGRLQGRHAAAGGERLPVARRAQGRGLRAHGVADDQQPRRHGHLQPRDRQVGRDRARRRRALLLRPRQLQRRDGEARARELGFDACMFMLHKTFGAPKGGGGPAVGAYGCTEELAPFLPAPVVVRDGDRYRLDGDRPDSRRQGPRVLRQRAAARVRLRLDAARWAPRASSEASDISVLANNYMEKRLLAIRGVTKSQPHLDRAAAWR